MSINHDLGTAPGSLSDSFIIPATSLWGKFRCAQCAGMNLRWSFEDGILILSCEDCGNSARTNFLMGNEVSSGGN